jgi:hypothetical protein
MRITSIYVVHPVQPVQSVPRELPRKQPPVILEHTSYDPELILVLASMNEYICAAKRHVPRTCHNEEILLLSPPTQDRS